MSIQPENERLRNIAANSMYAAGVNTDTIQYSFRIFSRHLAGETILELGPAEGVMTELLATRGMALTLVEGAQSFCEDLRRRFPSAQVHHSLFEDFETEVKFDNIVLGHVLEHVEDPVNILSLAKRWLASSGRILAAVPNARSLHRQAAVMMGMLPTEESLNSVDLHHGHRRVFTPESFRNTFLAAGFSIDVFGGYWLKPVSNAQIQRSWSPEMLAAFMQLGERYPDIAGEIYVIATQ